MGHFHNARGGGDADFSPLTYSSQALRWTERAGKHQTHVLLQEKLSFGLFEVSIAGLGNSWMGAKLKGGAARPSEHQRGCKERERIYINLIIM